ncbi:MAG: single-stranded DNA-binding protein [Clostridia bacterium]|nr:single-stranded DNA-binding protein [Clostridia bacterium]
MKQIFLTGRLVADPELREVGDYKAKYVTFAIANNDSGKDNVEFFDIRCWDKLAEFVAGYLKKGSKVIVQGTFDNDKFQDSEGKNRYHFSITANRIEFAG